MNIFRTVCANSLKPFFTSLGVRGRDAEGNGWRGGERPMVAVPGLAPAPARAIVCRSTHAAMEESLSSQVPADRRRRNTPGNAQAEGLRQSVDSGEGAVSPASSLLQAGRPTEGEPRLLCSGVERGRRQISQVRGVRRTQSVTCTALGQRGEGAQLALFCPGMTSVRRFSRSLRQGIQNIG